MNKAELIRHEIEKRRDHNLAIGNPLFAAMEEEDIELLSFIDSMQEEPVSKQNLSNVQRTVKDCKEPVSEGLEEAIEKSFIYHESRGDDFRSDKQIETAYRYGFETGAKWQKEQMMKGAVSGLVCAQRTNGEVMFRSNYVNKEGFKLGDKVKVIVIKEE